MAYVDLDERAIDALREFNEEGALTVLQQFKESDLSHVQVTTWMDYIAFFLSVEFHVQYYKYIPLLNPILFLM